LIKNHLLRVVVEGMQGLVGRHIPQLDVLVVAAGGDQRGVCVEGGGAHPVTVPNQRALKFARRKFPNLLVCETVMVMRTAAPYTCESMSLTLAVLSSDAVTRCLPSVEKFTDRTAPACPFRATDGPLLQVKQMKTYVRTDRGTIREGYLRCGYPQPDRAVFGGGR
jgi:hypothetical protein